jgi:antitoxin ParD1/3/4
MPTRNVVITDRQAAMIDKLVSGGEYQNASEVLRDGLRLVAERRAAHKAKIKAFREAAQLGIADIEAGRYRTFADRDELRDHMRSVAHKAIRAARATAQ